MASTDYESAGVNYDVLDAAKRTALGAAARTRISHDYGTAMPESRGQSAFVFRANGSSTLATVLECLGTKSVIAREYMNAGGPNLFDHVGFDAVASIINDLVSVGALPLVLNAYFATGSADWYGEPARFERLVAGWEQGCLEAGAVWGGGESPTLTGLVHPEDIELAGSAVGVIPPGKEPVLGQEIEHGNEIVFIGSTGLHTNGASLVRKIADRLEHGYLTRLGSGRQLGEAVLDKSALYAKLVAELGRADVAVTYYSHITGHGLRKLMRANKDVTYLIERLPLEVPEVLSFICDAGELDTRTAYATLNMGVGFVVFCAAGDGRRVVDVAERVGLRAGVAGHVRPGPRQVILQPLDITFRDEELQLGSDAPDEVQSSPNGSKGREPIAAR